jgi:hypothetical protein
MPEDPYSDPVTGVLHNKLGLGTAAELEAAEREITHAALILLDESPVSPGYEPASPSEDSSADLRRHLRVGRPDPDGGHRQGRHVLPPAVHRVLRSHHLLRAAR